MSAQLPFDRWNVVSKRLVPNVPGTSTPCEHRGIRRTCTDELSVESTEQMRTQALGHNEVALDIHQHVSLVLRELLQEVLMIFSRRIAQL